MRVTFDMEEYAKFNKTSFLGFILLLIGITFNLIGAISFKYDLGDDRNLYNFIFFGIGIAFLAIYTIIFILKKSQFKTSAFEIFLLVILTIQLGFGFYFAYTALDDHYRLEIMGEQQPCSENLTLNECSNADQTEYSKTFGIHSGFLGALFYSFTAAFMLVFMFVGKAIRDRLLLIPYLCFIGFSLYSLYLIYILLYVVNLVCVNCYIMHLNNFLMLLTFLFLIRFNIFKPIKDFFAKGLFDSKNVLIVIMVGLATIFSTLLLVYFQDNMIKNYKTLEKKAAFNKKKEDELQKIKDKNKNWAKDALCIIDAANNVKDQYKYAKVFDIDTTDSPFYGSDELGIEFQSYEDFACGACSILSGMLHKLVDEYDGKIKVCYKYYPLDNTCNLKMRRQMHPGSCAAAFAAQAAFFSGNFWGYHDKIYEKKGDIAKFDYFKTASDLNLDINTFTKHFQGEKVKNIIARDIAEARSFKYLKGEKVVGGTPTLFINGVLIKADKSPENFKMIIEAIRNDKNDIKRENM